MATRMVLADGIKVKTFAVLLFVAVAALTQTRTPAVSHHPGSEPYTPTKREWLLVCLVEDKAIFDSANSGGVQFTFSASDDDPDAINVLVAYTKSDTKDAVDKAFAFATDRIKSHAAEHGWNWVRIRNSEMALPEIHKSQ